ncbi:bacteriohemerythrin [Undibacterium sp. Di24W]|uniref:bacteriohemerythrin n=1 Tax=Undibacterium sp. Di24W TaxID=3413033 RepID=UPI003BF3AD06
MEYFEWSTSLSVHDPLMDADHQMLLNLVNELHSAAELGTDYLTLSAILEKIEKFTHAHFQKEEKLMLEIAYPKIESHCEQHRKFLDRVADLQQQLNRARDTVALETAELLRFWFTYHIMLSDKQLVDTLHGGAIDSE